MNKKTYQLTRNGKIAKTSGVPGLRTRRAAEDADQLATPPGEGWQWLPVMTEKPPEVEEGFVAVEGPPIIDGDRVLSPNWYVVEADGKPAPPSTQVTINALSTAYKTQIPEEYQGLPELLDIFANVGRLIELGEPEMAKARILNAEVPEELEALKPAFAAMIPTD